MVEHPRAYVQFVCLARDAAGEQGHDAIARIIQMLAGTSHQAAQITRIKSQLSLQSETIRSRSKVYGSEMRKEGVRNSEVSCALSNCKLHSSRLVH